MSLFDEHEVSCSVYLPNDNNTTKRTSFDYNTADYTMSINIIQLSPEEEVIFSQELASHKANIDSTDANSLVKGTRIDDGTNKFEITNDPVKRKFFDGTYTCRLRKINA